MRRALEGSAILLAFSIPNSDQTRSYETLDYGIGFVLVFVAPQVFAGEQSVLVRVTGYWRGEGSGERAAWNGARLHPGHCAVDPKKIPYGSKVVFPDTECVAVDTGPGGREPKIGALLRTNLRPKERAGCRSVF